MRKLNSSNELVAFHVLTSILLLLIALPVLAVVILSFTSGQSLQFPPPGWSLRWYEAAWQLIREGTIHGNGLVGSLFTSILISGLTAVIGILIGLPASYALVRLDFRGKMFVEQLITLPLVFPLVVLGVALLVMFSKMGVSLGFWRLVLADVIITLPFVVRNCSSSLVGISVTMEEAAVCLGAHKLRTFFEIIIPLMQPGIVAGGLLAFVIAFNEFTAAYFLYTVNAYPFSIWLFSKSNTSLDPVVFALSGIIVLFDVCFIIALDKLSGKQGVTI